MKALIFLPMIATAALFLAGCATGGHTPGPEVTYVSPDGTGNYDVMKCRVGWKSPLGEVSRSDCRSEKARDL